MRKMLVLGFLGALIASPALACGWGAGKTASDETKQTVMTDQATQTPTQGSGG